jgi:hypothetical protein
MSGRPESERAIYGIAADLLESGSPMHHASIALLLAAAIGFTAGDGSFLLAGSMMAGFLQGYFRLRTGFDVLLFRRLESGFDPAAFDLAMRGLGLLDERRIGRSAVVRSGGARRLLVGQAVSLAIQALCLVTAGAASLSDLRADRREAALGLTSTLVPAWEPGAVAHSHTRARPLAAPIKIETAATAGALHQASARLHPLRTGTAADRSDDW